MYADARVIVQFRLPSTWPVPANVTDKGVETPEMREVRKDHNADLGAFNEEFAINGATLANISKRLSSVGHKLVGADAQKRLLPASDYKPERPYQLLTFVFNTVGDARDDLHPLFESMTRQRYEYLTVMKRGGDKPFIVVVAKSVAQSAIQLADITDTASDAYGFVVTKSVPKDRRNAGSRGDVLDPVKTPFFRSGPRASSTVASSGDGQLDRLLSDGWTITQRYVDRVDLAKPGKNGGPQRTMTHCLKRSKKK